LRGVFNINGIEFLTIAVVALIVIGPRRLPAFARRVGEWAARTRDAAAVVKQELQAGIDRLDDDSPPEDPN
jgi:sec-independent protein translocase protein TatB